MVTAQRITVYAGLWFLLPMASVFVRRLTNHGLDLTAEDARFDTADESAAAKVLQRLRSEEASDGSTATKASGGRRALNGTLP